MTRRQAFLAIFLLCVGLLSYAYYEQFVRMLDPCPLCILQRLAVIGVALLALLAAIYNPARSGARVYAILTTIVALKGMLVAGRHLWIQHLPPEQVPSCGPGLDYMLKTMPLADAIKEAFRGSGECATVDWTFLGLSMPGWVFIWFVGIVFALWWIVLHLPRSKA